MANEKKNQDIIDFRYALIDKMYGSNASPNMANDAYKKALDEVLSEFNIHFRLRGYDVG